MAVIDMVMKGLEHCKNHDGTTCPECPYFHDDCVAKLCADALELLKEQKAMNVDSFVQWCIDNHIMGDATVQGIKYWVGKFKEGR